jgi:hypothetical protein
MLVTKDEEIEVLKKFFNMIKNENNFQEKEKLHYHNQLVRGRKIRGSTVPTEEFHKH